MKKNSFYLLKRFRLALLLVCLNPFFLPQTVFGHDEPDDPLINVLVFSKTAGFRHASIPDGIAMLQDIGTERGWAVTATEDATQFNDANLANFDVVVFLLTTGDVLNATEQGAFERYIQAGGGYAGIHSASDTEYSWPWYGDLVGEYFCCHPAQQTADILVEDHVHQSSRFLPNTWTRFDEWYNFATNPRPNVNVLMTLDESTYNPGGGAMGADHPIAWYHEYDGGRSFYTGMGHTSASYTSDFLFREHVTGGVEWAASYDGGWLGPAPDPNDFQRITVAGNLSQPMEFAIDDDGYIYIIGRCGQFWVLDPNTQAYTLTSTVPVRCDFENGLIGIALDPNFSSNRWVYLSNTPIGTDTVNISRFDLLPDYSLDLSSEKVLLSVGIQNDTCCHVGGCLEFGPDSLLYAGIGDNTNPFASGGYSPHDERPGRSPWDAQKSSSNTNDLRGGILRIQPENDGTYSIPPGNLFPGDALHRPEIYVMGSRNPFRFAIDPETNYLFFGEVGPDANSSDPNRGPSGYDEINIVKSAGNFGWPYFSGFNEAYNYFDFDTNTSGAQFDPLNPVNLSPNNTGANNLPLPEPAWLRYPHEAMMVGFVYRFDNSIENATKLPSYYDGHLFFWNFNNTDMFEVEMDDEGNNPFVSPFLPGVGDSNLLDMELDPNTHSMYALKYNSGVNGALYRFDYLGPQQGGNTPIVEMTATPEEGSLPLTVNFSSAGTFDPNGDPLTYEWDFTTDGTIDSTDPNPSFIYTTQGFFNAQLKVSDGNSSPVFANVEIRPGINSPEVEIDYPPQGGIFEWGDQINWSATINDLEDGSIGNGIDCEDLTMDILLNHIVSGSNHQHGLGSQNSCCGTFLTSEETNHADENVNLILSARFTDSSGATTTTQSILQLKHREAEHFSEMNGIMLEATSDTGGGQNVGFIDQGDWIRYETHNLIDIDSITFRLASASSGGTLELRLGSETAPVVNSIVVPGTGGWQTWISMDMLIPPSAQIAGTNDLFLTFAGGSNLFNINWFEFNGSGVGFLLGDANDDGVLDNLDISSFILALNQPLAYAAAFPNVNVDVVLDMNSDGVFNNLDIAPFGAALGF